MPSLVRKMPSWPICVGGLAWRYGGFSRTLALMWRGLEGLLSFRFDTIYEASFFQDIHRQNLPHALYTTNAQRTENATPAQSIMRLTWVQRPGRNNRDLLPDARFANAQTWSEPPLVAILRTILSLPQDGRGNMVRWTGNCCAGPRTERCNIDEDQLVKPCQALPVEMWFARLYAAH